MKIDESLLAMVPVRAEHLSKMPGCTHSCRHIPAALDEGKPLVIYPLRLNVSEGKVREVALCRECYARNRAAGN